jgi:hypothetical protein
LNVTDEGISRTYIDTDDTKLYTWDKIASIYFAQTLICILLTNKSTLIVPKRYFLPDTGAAEFIDIIKSRISERTVSLYNESDIIQTKPPYWMGFLCFIPLIGAFVGLALIINGLIKYKNKWLVFMGIGGIIFTVTIYTSLFLWSNSAEGKKGFAPFAQSNLNILFKEIEFYKLQHGNYPDSLGQLKTKDDFLSINDPLQNFDNKKRKYRYNYKKIGRKYYLFSSGVDGIPNTVDDIYPQMSITDTF